MKTLAERFWEKVDRRSPEECWNWKAVRSGNGYGMIRLTSSGSVRSRMEQAHRVAWSLTNGPIPDGMIVLHECDNKRCCNPDHLRIGTHADNTADKVSKCRQARGETQGSAKLLESQVLAIRVDTRRAREVARQYGVHKATIVRIRRGESWAWLGAAARQ